jgi:hypothetical protein
MADMHIDSYEFGRIVIDGVAYNSDCLILGGSVRAGWWRKKGHMLSVKDVQPIIEVNPDILVVGCGALGMMKVPAEIQKFLTEHKIEVEMLSTSRAVERFNELSQSEANVAAALHLTC